MNTLANNAMNPILQTLNIYLTTGGFLDLRFFNPQAGPDGDTSISVKVQ